MPLTALELLVFRKQLHAARHSLQAVEITEDEMQAVLHDIPSSYLPDTASVMISVLEDATEERPGGLVHFIGGGGSGAANLLGRFCQLDTNVEDLAMSIVRREADMRPEAIIAEISHLPEARVSNVIRRTALREFEIPFLARAGVGRDRQIPVDDLMVSIVDNSIVLRSARLGKPVLPRLSSAHNFTMDGLPVYQFLCDLQSQDCVTGFVFPAGPLEGEFRTSPRITYRNAVLCLASWTLARPDFEAVLGPGARESGRLRQWRERWSLPRHMALANGDNELYVDLDNELSTRAFTDAIGDRSTIRLVEFLFDPAKAVARNEQGALVNQFVVSFHKKEGTSPKPLRPAAAADAVAVPHQFIMNDEWLYFKFYAGPTVADHLVSGILGPLSDELEGAGSIDRWFFVRYADPDHHVRYRVRTMDVSRTGDIIAAIHGRIKPYVDSDAVWKVQMDTYKRELDRYGSASIGDVEAIFGNDSRAVCQMLSAEGEGYPRWRAAMASVDRYLDDLGYSLNRKIEILTTYNEAFKAEFGKGKATKDRFNDKYRELRRAISDSFGAAVPPAVQEALAARSLSNQPHMRFLRETLDQEALSLLANSMLHMHLNRLFEDSQRAQEMVVYELLERHYTSVRAIRKQQETITAQNI